MTSVLFLFRRNRAKWLREWQAGEGSSEFLYGMPFLDPARYKMRDVAKMMVAAELRNMEVTPFNTPS
jgi:hypothetical protein